MTAETCPASVRNQGGTWGNRWHRCDRPIKRDGLCGLHAAAKERRERNVEERASKREEGAAIAGALTDLLGLPVSHFGGSYTISRTHVQDWWEQQQRLRAAVSS